MKMMKRMGDRTDPCATPVSNVMVALCWSFGAILTVDSSYRLSRKSTSGMRNFRIRAHRAAWLIELYAFEKSTSTRRNRLRDACAFEVISSIFRILMSVERACL